MSISGDTTASGTGTTALQQDRACPPYHIRSQASTPKRSDYALNGRKCLSSHVSFYSEGCRARVQRQLERHTCFKCGNMFTVEAYRAGKVLTCRTCRRGKVDWKRGKVQTFSLSSRRRLMSWLNALKPEVKPMFTTLTYPDTYLKTSTPKAWKRDLKAFEDRFRRAYPEGAFLWRLEVVDRKSGVHVGAIYPHFHLLVFLKGVSVFTFRAWVKRAWYEVVGTGDIHHLKAGTEVSFVNSRQGIRAYASKGMAVTLSAELAKQIQTEAGQSVGRWWGISQWGNFVNWLSGVTSQLVTDVQASKILRLFRRLIGVDFRRSLPSLTVSIEARTIRRILAPPEGRTGFRVTGRVYNLPFMAWAFMKGRVQPDIYQAWAVAYKEG